MWKTSLVKVKVALMQCLPTMVLLILITMHTWTSWAQELSEAEYNATSKRCAKRCTQLRTHFSTGLITRERFYQVMTGHFHAYLLEDIAIGPPVVVSVNREALQMVLQFLQDLNANPVEFHNSSRAGGQGAVVAVTDQTLAIVTREMTRLHRLGGPEHGGGPDERYDLNGMEIDLKDWQRPFFHTNQTVVTYGYAWRQMVLAQDFRQGYLPPPRPDERGARVLRYRKSAKPKAHYTHLGIAVRTRVMATLLTVLETGWRQHGNEEAQAQVLQAQGPGAQGFDLVDRLVRNVKMANITTAQARQLTELVGSIRNQARAGCQGDWQFVEYVLWRFYHRELAAVRENPAPLIHEVVECLQHLQMIPLPGFRPNGWRRNAAGNAPGQEMNAQNAQNDEGDEEEEEEEEEDEEGQDQEDHPVNRAQVVASLAHLKEELAERVPLWSGEMTAHLDPVHIEAQFPFPDLLDQPVPLAQAFHPSSRPFFPELFTLNPTTGQYEPMAEDAAVLTYRQLTTAWKRMCHSHAQWTARSSAVLRRCTEQWRRARVMVALTLSQQCINKPLVETQVVERRGADREIHVPRVFRHAQTQVVHRLRAAQAAAPAPAAQVEQQPQPQAPPQPPVALSMPTFAQLVKGQSPTAVGVKSQATTTTTTSTEAPIRGTKRKQGPAEDDDGGPTTSGGGSKAAKAASSHTAAAHQDL